MLIIFSRETKPNLGVLRERRWTHSQYLRGRCPEGGVVRRFPSPFERPAWTRCVQLRASGPMSSRKWTSVSTNRTVNSASPTGLQTRRLERIAPQLHQCRAGVWSRTNLWCGRELVTYWRGSRDYMLADVRSGWTCSSMPHLLDNFLLPTVTKASIDRNS